MAKIDKAVLLAAGRGTRMRDLTADLPKPMIKVRGKPILLHIVEGLQGGRCQYFLIRLWYRNQSLHVSFLLGICFEFRFSYAIHKLQDVTSLVVLLAR